MRSVTRLIPTGSDFLATLVPSIQLPDVYHRRLSTYYTKLAGCPGTGRSELFRPRYLEKDTIDVPWYFNIATENEYKSYQCFDCRRG